MRGALLGLALVSCATTSETTALKHVQTASIGYDIPDDWDRAQTNRRGISTTVWTPKDNPDRMSVTVIRSERSPVTAGADVATIGQLLVQAQSALHDARLSPAVEVITPQGLKGARVELDYTPPEAKNRYHRTHVVLADGSGLVHVIFTARSTERAAAFDTVLASLRHEEVLP